MGKRKAKSAVKVEDEPVKKEEDDQKEEPQGLVPYELERLAIIQRNRERLMALGLPGLVQKLQELTQQAAPKAKKPARKRAKKADETVKIKLEEDEASEGGPRRSRRIAEVAAQPPKPAEETAEERFDRQLGEFIVDGTCPKCGKIYEKGHSGHLRACGGAKPESSAAGKGYSARDKELLADLTEEERKDVKKRTVARMKVLELSGLVDYSPEAAKFVVIGSKGDPYTVTLADEKHKCTCLDHRFRRHNCKHICLVLAQVGALDAPEKWREGVESQLDELIKKGSGEDEGKPPVAPPPKNAAAEMAAKFL